MQQQTKMSSVVMRHVAAFSMLPIFVAYIYYLPPNPYFLGLLILTGMIGLREFFVMYRVPAVLNVTGVLFGGVLLYLFCCYPAYAVYAIFGVFCLLMLIRLFGAPSPDGSMSDLGPLGVGFFYVAGCMSFQWFLRDMDGADGLKYVFMLYLSVWGADSLAFYIGTYLGKNRLIPKISPKKTIEGSVGSILGGVLGTIVARALFGMSGLSLPFTVFIGAVIGVTALVGDLIESMFKRDAGVKDSGTLIPGHGGILDRLDGMLVAGPVLYFIVRYM